MKTRKSFSIVGTAMVAVFALGLGFANANIIPTLNSVTPDGANFLWTYDLTLSADQTVFGGAVPATAAISALEHSTATFFTIYDFAGYVPGSAAGPASWFAKVQNVGITPADTLPVDNSSIANITWYYVPPRASATLVGPLDLGDFTAESIFSQPTLVSYASRAEKSGDKSITDNVGTTSGPTSAVPEPGTLLLLGFGLVGLVRMRTKSKK